MEGELRILKPKKKKKWHKRTNDHQVELKAAAHNLALELLCQASKADRALKKRGGAGGGGLRVREQ